MRNKNPISRFSDLLIVWLILAVLLGFYGSTYMSRLIFMAPYTLAVMMFSVGLTIQLKEFSSTRNKVIPATLTQWIMPLVGYLVGRILGVPPEVILGLVILGAVSNDITSSVFVKITARSASLSALVTITSTVASLFILPLSALLLLGQVFEFDPSSILFGLLIFVLIPLLVGLFLRTRGLHVDENKALGLASLALIVLIGISSSQISIGFLVIPIILASLLMNLAGYAIGYGSAKHFKYDVASGIYLVGLREFGVAMTVLIVADLPIEALTVPIVYGIVQTFTATVLSKYIRK